jgi:hypothetical protein
MVNKAKLQSYQHDPFWKLSVIVPQTHAQAIDLDKQNNKSRWHEAESPNMGQLLDYETFVDKGIALNVPSEYKRIRCHMIYDVKHDGRHKDWLVVGGPLTNTNTESVYSGVVLLQGI